MPSKKIIQKESTEVLDQVDITTVDLKPIDEQLDEDDKTYNSFDDVQKALVDIDKQIMILNRARIQLTKLSQKFYTGLSKQLRKRTKSEKLGNKVNISGFNKPAKVPSSICKYLGLPVDTQLPRTTVTHQLYEKIKEQNLLNSDDKRVIIVNQELKDLFKMEADEDQISFLNFQKYLSRAYNSDKQTSEEIDDVDSDNVEDDDEEEEIVVEKKPQPQQKSKKKSVI